MLQIILDEYTNGYSLVVYDSKTNYSVKEVFERKIDAFMSLRRTLQGLLDKETEAMQNSLKGD